MVKIGTLLTLGAVGAGILAFYRLGGAAGIGSRIGGGFESLLSGITTGISGGINATQRLTDTSGGTEENIVKAVVEQEALSPYVQNVPTTPQEKLTGIQKGLLTYAGFIESQGIQGKIDLETGVFSNRFTSQPLNFTINRTTGGINTGTQGLSSATVAAQQALSAKYGIPTFDVAGNLSTFGGLRATS